MAAFSDVKLRNLPQYLRATFAPNNLQQVWRDFSVQYGGKYFGIKGSSRPVFHVILGVFALSYALEYPHLKKEAMRKYH